jgi:hypothetical protein
MGEIPMPQGTGWQSGRAIGKPNRSFLTGLTGFSGLLVVEHTILAVTRQQNPVKSCKSCLK